MSVDHGTSIISTTSRYQNLTSPKPTALRGLTFQIKPPQPQDFFIRPKPQNRSNTHFFPRGREKPLGAYIDFGFPKVTPNSRASGSHTRGSASYSVRSTTMTPHPDVIALQVSLFQKQELSSSLLTPKYKHSLAKTGHDSVFETVQEQHIAGEISHPDKEFKTITYQQTMGEMNQSLAGGQSIGQATFNSQEAKRSPYASKFDLKPAPVIERLVDSTLYDVPKQVRSKLKKRPERHSPLRGTGKASLAHNFKRQKRQLNNRIDSEFERSKITPLRRKMREVSKDLRGNEKAEEMVVGVDKDYTDFQKRLHCLKRSVDEQFQTDLYEYKAKVDGIRKLYLEKEIAGEEKGEEMRRREQEMRKEERVERSGQIRMVAPLVGLSQ